MICFKMTIWGFRRKISSVFAFLCLVFVTSCLFLSHSVSAISPSQTGRVGVSSITVKDDGTPSSPDGYDLSVDSGSGLGRGNRSSASNIRDIYIRYSGTIPAHSITAVTINLSGQWVAIGDMKFNGAIGNNYWSLIDQDCNTSTEPGGVGRFNTSCTLWYYTTVADNQINLAPSDNSRIFTISGEYSITVQAGTYYTTTDAESFVLDTRRNQILDGIESKIAFDILPELKAIKEAIAGVDSAGIIASIESGNQQAHDDALAQKEATDKQTQQQKEQYEQEKQEEQDRENQGKSDMDDATGIFNFNLLNPFAGIFGLFKSHSTCASIPTLAAWVHSDTSVVCSWWSSSVVSVLTPVFGIFSMMIVFGFLVSWLGGAGQGRGIDIGWDSQWYGPHSGEKF